jgi:hypothetical protein
MRRRNAVTEMLMELSLSGSRGCDPYPNMAEGYPLRSHRQGGLRRCRAEKGKVNEISRSRTVGPQLASHRRRQEPKGSAQFYLGLTSGRSVQRQYSPDCGRVLPLLLQTRSNAARAAIGC